MARVLLLTASFGDGHNQAARALREVLVEMGHEVRVEDYVQWLHPAVRRVAKFSFRKVITEMPTLYGLIYRRTSHIHPLSPINRQLNKLGAFHLQRVLATFKPEVVAGTFPTPLGIISELQASGLIRIPNAAILTDYTCHAQWIHECTDLYFVASEAVKKTLVSEFEVPENKIKVTGIPVRRTFLLHDLNSPNARRTLRQRFTVNEHMPLVMVMGGGEGLLADLSAYMPRISRLNAQFVLICGRNEELYQELAAFQTKRIRVLGYTDEINQWMAMSDLIVTKPGGITISEALALQVPMLLFQAIPGQEQENAEYAVQTGVAKAVLHMDELIDTIEHMLRHPEVLDQMKHQAGKYSHPHAARDIARDLIRLADRSLLVASTK